MKVCELDKIAVNDPQFANARPGQHFGMSGTEGTAAHEQDAGIEKLFLAITADLAEQNLAGVTLVHLVKQLLHKAAYARRLILAKDISDAEFTVAHGLLEVEIAQF